MLIGQSCAAAGKSARAPRFRRTDSISAAPSEAQLPQGEGQSQMRSYLDSL